MNDLNDAKDLLEREVAFLDERRWDDWLALYTPDCEYWMPAWKTEEELTTDPNRELSHLYYANRAGLEDRIVRIRSGRSPASVPMPRTTHILGNVLVTTPTSGEELGVRSSWVCHVYFPRSKDSHAFFGHNEFSLVRKGADWLIRRKKIVMQNDYIPSMLDIYCA